MANFEAKDIRNIMLLGHSGCGKTSLAEALTYSAGVIPKMGAIDDGTTVSDYNEDEKERKCSISSSLLSFVHNSKKINMVDTPGYTDFVGGEICGDYLTTLDFGYITLNVPRYFCNLEPRSRIQQNL